MYIDTTFPPPDCRLAQLMRVLDNLDADTIGAAVDAMIDRLDAMSPDPDLEPNGDDEFTGDEHGDVAWMEYGDGPGGVMLHTIGHEDAEPEAVDLIRPHRERIRRTRCDYKPWPQPRWPLRHGGDRRPQRMGFEA